MPVGKGRKFIFHGAFKSKRAAVKKERAGKGRFILNRTIKGHRRYLVLKRRGGK